MENAFSERKDIRLKNYDYSTAGAYFVTVCTAERRCLLSKINAPADGNIVGDGASPSPTNKMLPHIISTFKRFCHKEIGRVIFQRSFHDHVIRNGADYDDIAKYIQENPLRWRLDALFAEK